MAGLFHLWSGCARCFSYEMGTILSEHLFTENNGACQESRAVFENQLISCHWFAQRVKQCCSQSSERLLRAPVDEKDGPRKIASIREGAVLVERCAADCVVPLSCRNQSGRFGRKGFDNKAWSLPLVLTVSWACLTRAGGGGGVKLSSKLRTFPHTPRPFRHGPRLFPHKP